MSRSDAHRWRAAVGAVGVLLMLAGGMASGAAPASASVQSKGASEGFRVSVPEAPGSDASIGIDVELYLPAGSRPAPAVLLAHGFGGSKRSLAGDAERLQREGYVVMAYSARGFGRSGGRISLDSLDYEVADAKRLVDVLGSRSEVEKHNGDPVVGVYGASYGGALALMLGATDPRIDAVVASITWNDLLQSLVPQSATGNRPSLEPGVFKKAWATQLFGAAASPFAGACGRFTAQLCALYTKLVGGGQLDDADRTLLSASSPSAVLDGMTAPTLLLQGTQDTLFGLDQADANARQITAAGAPVKVSWFAGGHDGGLTRGTTAAVDEWLFGHLRRDVPAHRRVERFSFTVPTSARSFAETRVAASYPGLGRDGSGVETLQLHGRPRLIVNPPGGLPATISSLPGTGPLDSIIDGAGIGVAGTAAQPAQQAGFDTDAITTPFVLVGSPTVSVDVSLPRFRREKQDAASSADPTVVELFAQLRVVTGSSDVAVGGGVAPMRVALPADGSATTVDVRLPATTWRFERGDRVSLSLRSTDAGYQGSTAPATFVLRSAGAISLPTVTSTDPAAAAGAPSRATLVGIPIVLLIALLFGVFAALSDRRRTRAAGSAAHQNATQRDGQPPLVIRGLTKNYRAGFRAVDDLSFTVQRGQVLGLLGSNGAGKTTALRMVTGLLRPDAGEIEIFGERVTPGSPVLTRVGCFIEGPGFLPHLSGRRNLRLFWAASGRPRADARLAEALEIADLGTAVDRRVSGYSQGMRQRLAIAQAMLGMPELLILDEPTNGLDPPQIFALRGMLRRYAESGRTVIVSSHLLGEVEQTCSDVVVMARGRLLAAGPVAELAGETNELTIEVTDVAGAVSAVGRLPGAEALMLDTGTIRVLPAENTPEAIVAAIAASGIGIRSVTRGRHLEETFLAMVGSEGIV